METANGLRLPVAKDDQLASNSRGKRFTSRLHRAQNKAKNWPRSEEQIQLQNANP